MSVKQVGKVPTASTDTPRLSDLRPSFRNRLVNGNFAINQRGAASASTAYAAGAYVMDRWKSGASGCTLSFATAANGDVTVTITAGTLVQVIEGAVYVPEGGAYVLSWGGTATARVYQGTASGSYAVSPIALTSLTAGTNTTVEFSSGTVGLVQIEAGNVPTVFERRDDEILRSQRYFVAGNYYILMGAGGAGYFCPDRVRFPRPMRAIPQVAVTQVGSSNSSAPMTDQPKVDGVLIYVAASAAGNVQNYGTYTATAEL